MYVILTYDVNQKRVQKVMRICRKYLHHMQDSVFEGPLTEATLTRLKEDINKKINTETDGVIIYRFETLKYSSREEIGNVRVIENVIG